VGERLANSAATRGTANAAAVTRLPRTPVKPARRATARGRRIAARDRGNEPPRVSRGRSIMNRARDHDQADHGAGGCQSLSENSRRLAHSRDRAPRSGAPWQWPFALAFTGVRASCHWPRLGSSLVAAGWPAVPHRIRSCS